MNSNCYCPFARHHLSGVVGKLDILEVDPSTGCSCFGLSLLPEGAMLLPVQATMLLFIQSNNSVTSIKK